MTDPFRIFAEPIGSNNPNKTIKWTTSKLVIEVNGKMLTRANDDWAHSVSDGVHLSVYPLALWFASNYWRLLYEPTHLFTADPDLDWKMAHCMSAVGDGYVWPNIKFETDGEFIMISSKATELSPSEPISYIGNYFEIIPIKEFEKTISNFVQMVINRLEANSIRESDLHDLWKEIKEEQRDEASSKFRIMEASVGADPDEMEGPDIESLLRLGTEIGEAAALEIARVCSKVNAREVIKEIEKIKEYTGTAGQLNKDLIKLISKKCYRAERSFPWDYGRALAKLTRELLPIKSDFVLDKEFESLIGINDQIISNPETRKAEILFGFASLVDEKGKLKIHFKSNLPTSRRFSAARLFADAVLVSTNKDKCLPITDAATYRQKIQRAFAAEFLCPIDRLIEFLDGDLSEEKQQEASDYFRVSPWTISSHLRNNQKITFEQMVF